jgi:hypothetical protein
LHISGLGCDSQSQKIDDPEEVADNIIKAILTRWDNGCDILHVHNPILAKNINFCLWISLHLSQDSIF